jgi:hypothetical protein
MIPKYTITPIPPFLKLELYEDNTFKVLNMIEQLLLCIMFDILFGFGLKACGNNIPHPFKHIILAILLLIQLIWIVKYLLKYYTQISIKHKPNDLLISS